MPSMSDRARAMYRSMPSPPSFGRSASGKSKSGDTDRSEASENAGPTSSEASDATTSGRPEPNGVTNLKTHSRHPSSVSDITVDSDYDGSDGGNDSEVSEATALEQAERDREMYRTLSPSLVRSPRASMRARGGDKSSENTENETTQNGDSDTLGDLDDELRRLEDVPQISLENFMSFKMRGPDESGYESDAPSEMTTSEFEEDENGIETSQKEQNEEPTTSHYDQDTDLEVAEEVDPRVGAALDEMNQSMTSVNDLEKNLIRARRRRKQSRAESEQKLELIRLRVAKSVRNAVPYFHQQALASVHERNSQLAMLQYEKAHDAFIVARDTVECRMIQWRAEREDAEGAADTESESNLTPSKRADLAAMTEALELSARIQFANSSNLTELEALKLRAEQVYGKHIHGLTESVNAALRMKRKLVRTILKARPYFEAKAMAEGAWDKLDEAVEDAKDAVKEGKQRYQRSLDALGKISEEVHERREREKAERLAELEAEEEAREREAEEVVSYLVSFAMETVLARAEAEERARRDAAEAAAREAAAKEAAVEQAAAEKAAAEREAAEREAAEKTAAEQAVAEREAAEASAREAAEREAAATAEREAQNKAALAGESADEDSALIAQTLVAEAVDAVVNSHSVETDSVETTPEEPFDPDPFGFELGGGTFVKDTTTPVSDPFALLTSLEPSVSGKDPFLATELEALTAEIPEQTVSRG